MGFNAETMAAVNCINLESVRQRFLARKGWWWRLWHGWKIEDIEEDYREFLYLIATNPGETIVPWNQEMDDFWHEHILDTRNYERDCKSLGVKAIHHNPDLPKGSYRHSMGVQTTKQVRQDSGVTSRSEPHTSSYSGCAAYTPWLYSSNDCAPSSHNDSSSSHSDCGHSHGDSSSHSSCSGSSDSGSSCGGSSCGGSSCGGGGD